MTRRQYPYTDWEDYRAGLYGLTWIGTSADSVALLSRPVELETAMRRAVNEWPNSAAHHLTGGEMNHRAWLGWAACGIAKMVPAHLTRAAWWTLNESQRDRANAAADAVMADYERRDVQALPF